MAIKGGKDMLNHMIGGSGDIFIGDEMAHSKQQANVTVGDLNHDPGL
jgi:hypothetical protein